ncbi:VOC family protein [Microbacterium yannicii]|uniref:VOC family protein n=1 Tax=Microbacterium yannicii TaxID=671622 RepID=UPI00035D900F|nr:VOC family protein [Microbacterium yannicii]
MTTALVVNHVGISVPDIVAAIDWYEKLFGFRCIMGPRVMRPSSEATAETRQILGDRFREAWQAHLLTANGVGLELFQFIDPVVEPGTVDIEYWRQGLWHLCLTDPDVAGAVARIVEAGGTQASPVTLFVPGKPYTLVYCRDPWGTTLEIMSHSYTEVFASWPQPGMELETEWATADAVGRPAK